MPTDEQIEAAAKVLYDRSRRGLLDGPPSWEQAPTQAKAYYIGNAAAALAAADAVAPAPEDASGRHLTPSKQDEEPRHRSCLGITARQGDPHAD